MINGGIINTVAAAAEVCTTNDSSFPVANTAYYKLDGDATDSAGTYNGTPSSITWGVGRFGPAAVFNGSGSHIDFQSPIPYTNTDMTFSCWINLASSFSSSYKAIIGAGNKTGGEGRIRLLIRYMGTNSYRIEPIRAYSGNSYYTSATSYPAQTIYAGTWYNLVYTYSATGNTAKIYLNGSLVSTTNLTITSTDTDSGVLALGQYRDNPNPITFWDGSMDQVRIFPTTLTQAQVTELYEDEIECCTTDEVNYPVTNLAYYQLNGGTGTTVVDETNTYDGTSSNVTYGAGLFNDAAVFNGSNSYTLTTNLKSQNVGTFSFWFKGSTPAGLATLFNNNFVSSNNKGVMIQGQSNGTIRVYISQGNGIGALDVYTTNTFFDNNWHNAVLTWDLNSTGTNTYLYIDNVVEASGAANTGVWTFGQDSTYGLFIGAGRTNIQFFNGSIDQVRIFNTALTQGQVAELYQEKQCGSLASTTEWIGSDDIGNLFYTEDETGLTGWTDSGQNLGGYVRDAVYNGSVWVACGNGVWQTSDITAKSGWTQIITSGTYYSVMWTGTGWVATGFGLAKYTTDISGASGWTNFTNVNSAGYYLGAANDGTNTFMGIRDLTSQVQEYGYNTSGFFGSLSYKNVNISSNFARGTFYDPANSRYFVFGAQANIVYSSTLNFSTFYSINAQGGSGGYGKMQYNGTYYVLDGGSGSGIVYSTNSISGYAFNGIASALGWDRIAAPNWNGTSWGTGGRYTSGSNVFAFKNNSNPSGAFTGVSKPTGFNGNRNLGTFPSKRPYYNAITNLGF